MGESSAAEHDQLPKKWWAGSLTCGFVIDQRCDLRLSRQWLSALVVVEHPLTAPRRPHDGPRGCESLWPGEGWWV